MSRKQYFDYSVNLLQSLLWEYEPATNLQNLLQGEQDWYNTNQTEFWLNWYDDVFNLATANQFGLTVWATILGIPITAITPPTEEDHPTWGFGIYNENFNNGNFGNLSSNVVRLTLEQQRIILQLRYYQLVSRGTVPEINFFLNKLFGGEGLAYVLDGLNMTATYIFTFQPSSSLLFIFDFFDLLPRPAGVGVRYEIITEPAFGFGEYNTNFNNGNFAG